MDKDYKDYSIIILTIFFLLVTITIGIVKFTPEKDYKLNEEQKKEIIQREQVNAPKVEYSADKLKDVID